MLKRKILYIAVMALLVMSGCSEREPEIKDSLQFTIEPINEEELQILLNRSGYFTKEEFKQHYAVVSLQYEITNGRKFDELTVTHHFDWDLLLDAVELQHGVKYFNGSGKRRNYNNGSFKFYTDRFIFYANDFSVEELQRIFDTYVLHISWKNADGEFVEETLPIGDFLEDKR